MIDDENKLINSPMRVNWKLICVLFFTIYSVNLLILQYTLIWMKSSYNDLPLLTIPYNYPNETQFYLRLLCGMNLIVVYNKLIEMHLFYNTSKQDLGFNYTGLSLLIITTISNVLISFPTLTSVIFGDNYLINDGYLRTTFTISEWIVSVPMMFYICLSYDSDKDKLSIHDILIFIISIISMCFIYISKILINHYHNNIFRIPYLIGTVSILSICVYIQYKSLQDFKSYSNKSAEITSKEIISYNKLKLTKKVSFRNIVDSDEIDELNELRFPIINKDKRLSPCDVIKKQVVLLRFQLCIFTVFVFFSLTILHSSKDLFLSLDFTNQICSNNENKVYYVNTFIYIVTSLIKISYSYIVTQDQTLLFNPNVVSLLKEQRESEINRIFLKNNLHEIRELLHSIYLCLSIIREEFYSRKIYSNTSSQMTTPFNNITPHTSNFSSGTTTPYISSTRQIMGKFFSGSSTPYGNMKAGFDHYDSNERIFSPSSNTVASSMNLDLYDESLNIIEEAVSFMDQTLQDVVSIREIEQGIIELKLEYFLIQSVTQRITNSLRGQLTLKDINLSIWIDPDVPSTMYGDRFRIEHVLANFLSNAIKFSNHSSEIKINVISSDKDITFSVIDQGIGISPEDQKLLFNNYVQFDPGANQNGNGTGIGLAICKETIRLHGGIVGCKSTKRIGNSISTGGSEFYFKLPLRKPNDEINESTDISNTNTISKTETTTSSQCNIGLSSINNSANTLKESKSLNYSTNSLDLLGRAYIAESEDSLSSMETMTPTYNQNSGFRFINNPSIPIKRYRALIADDVPSNRKILQKVLSRKGLECDLANSGLSLLMRFRSKPVDYYDFIFTDNLMPNMNGSEAVGILRKEGYTNIIIGLTGNTMDSDIQELQKAGADKVFAKPLRTNELDEYLEKNVSTNFKSLSYITNH